MAMPMADAVGLVEMEDPEAAGFAATADNHGISARNAISPFGEVDEQIADAIILLNRLPNAIERQARGLSKWYAQKAERSQGWVRKHEPELMKRTDVSSQILSLYGNLR
jgi:hypothetical protein